MNNKNDSQEKTQKTFLGLPMKWDARGIVKTLWNPDDDRVFPPKSFGIGWTINLHAFLRGSGILKKSKRG